MKSTFVKEPNKKDIITGIVKLAIQWGCSSTCSSIISAVLPAGTGVFSTACMKVGSMLVGASAGDIAADYGADYVNDAIEAYKDGQLANYILTRRTGK